MHAHRHNSLLHASLIASTIVGVTTLSAQSLDSLTQRRIDSVFTAYSTGNVPGCAVSVTRNGALVYARGYGMASLEQQVPITPRTVFDLGSVSKQFTATSVLLLQLDGKLSLDDDVRKYLPELPNLGARVTLRHLLTHTSGWRDYNDLLVIDGRDERDHTTDRDAWDSLKRQRALNFAPGSTYRYSNTGYFLLGQVVKRVAGATLAQFAQARIFTPLGMTQTRYLDDTRTVVPGRATAYTPADSGYQVEMSNWDQLGDGAVQSTVEDLAKWEANFTSGTVGGPPLRALLTTHGRLNSGAVIAYTAGLGESVHRGVQTIAHGGAWAGYRAGLMHFPTARVGVLLTCNRADAETDALGYGVAETLISFTPRLPVRTQAGAKLGGLYVSDATGTSFTLTMRGDTLLLGEGPDAEALTLMRDGAYQTRNASASMSVSHNRLILSRVDDESVTDTLTRRQIVPAMSRAVRAAYVGVYTSPEIANTYRVIETGSGLVLRRDLGDDIPLQSAYADAFDTATLGTIAFARGAGDRVVAMRLTSRGVHDLRLPRRQ
jgi:CubicO group peptidase (beta-lactamase class C family)